MTSVQLHWFRWTWLTDMWRADGFNIKMSCWHAFQCSQVSQNQLLLIGRSKAHLWHWTLKSFPPITDSVNSRCEECVPEKMIRWNVHAHHIDIFCSWYVVDKRKWTTNLVMEAIRRQRDTLLVPTQILFTSQTTTKMCPRVHDESTTLNNKFKPSFTIVWTKEGPFYCSAAPTGGDRLTVRGRFACRESKCKKLLIIKIYYLKLLPW